MDLTALLSVCLLLLTNLTALLAAIFFYRKWRQGQRLAVLSEQSRASRVRSETARQVIKRQHFFISRYVKYLETPTRGINELTEKIAQSQDLAAAHKGAAQLQSRMQLLLQSISNLKDYASMEVGELTLHPEPVSSRLLLEEAISTMRTFLSSNQQHLLLDIKSWQDYKIIVDKGKFCSMLGHLGHAIATYLPKGCNINFTAESIRSGENRIVTWLRISDSDTDYEVPSNEQLFDPLNETLPLQESASNISPITSLDLPFARQLAELMGGTLNFRRTSEGHAAEIELFFNVGE